MQRAIFSSMIKALEFQAVVLDESHPKTSTREYNVTLIEGRGPSPKAWKQLWGILCIVLQNQYLSHQCASH